MVNKKNVSVKKKVRGKNNKKNKKTKKHPHKDTKNQDTIKYIIYGVIFIVGLFLILAFISRIIDTSNDSYYTYNGFDFVESNGMVKTQIQLESDRTSLYTIELRYGPRDLEDIPVIGEPKYFNIPEEMYVAFDPEDEDLQYIALASADIQMNLARVLGKKLKAACTVDAEGCENVSIKDCGNSELPIIIVRQDPVALVEQRGSCLYVQGDGMDVVKAADRFLLNLYGIMEN